MTDAEDNHRKFVGPDGIWRQLRLEATSLDVRPILFLDRDGVVVEEVDYLHRVSDVRFIDGVSETVVLARQAGWRIAMVTNQAGIGRGYYGWNEFAAVNRSILGWLDQRGAVVDAVLAAPHHPEGAEAYRHPAHPMRKPRPGMLLAAAGMLRGDLASSIIVGDNVSDQQAGIHAGLKRGFHVLTGHGQRYRVESASLGSAHYGVHVIADVGDAGLRDVLAAAHQKIEEVRP